LNSAIMAIMQKTKKPFATMGEISLIAKANGKNDSNIPIIGMTDKDISQTFITKEGQSKNGCSMFSEVEFTYENGKSITFFSLFNAHYNPSSAIWTAKWVEVMIDETVYTVNFDKYCHVAGNITMKPVKGSYFDGDIPVHRSIGGDAGMIA